MTRQTPLATILMLMAGVIGCAGQAPAQAPTGPGGQATAAAAVATYAHHGASFTYQLEYPASWSVQESGAATRFTPPGGGAAAGTIAVLVVDYSATPPPPVAYTYATVRVVRRHDGEVRVQTRAPAPAGEAYMAEIKNGNFVVGFLFSADRKYDDVFDRMIATFTFTR